MLHFIVEPGERYFSEGTIDLKIAVAENLKNGGKYQDILLNDSASDVVKIADAQKMSSSTISKLYGLYSDKIASDKTRWSDLVMAIAGNPNTPPDVLANVEKYIFNGWGFKALCGNPKLREEFIRSVEAGNTQDWINKYSPHETSMLSCVVEKVDSNIPIKSARAIYELNKTDRFSIRIISKNKDIPNDLMQEFITEIKSKNPPSRRREYFILENPALLPKDIDELCTSKEPELLDSLASNPSITGNCIEILAGDIIKSGKIEKEISYSQVRILEPLASNPASPKTLLKIVLEYAAREYYTSNPEFWRHFELAAISRPDIDLNDVLEYLTKDSKEVVVKNYEGYPQLGMPVSPNPMSRFLSYKEAFESRFERLPDTAQKKSFIEYAVDSQSQYLRAFAAGHPDTHWKCLHGFRGTGLFLCAWS